MFEQIRNRTPGIIDWKTYKKTGVLVPLIQTDKGYSVLFEVRSKQLKNQPGEICFPGGKKENGEKSIDTVIRETCEELLISPENIEIIAPMDKFVSPYNLVVSPYLGILKDYQWTFSRDEVDEVFTVPLQFFMDEEPKDYVNTLKVEPDKNFPYHLIPNGADYPWYNGTYKVSFYTYESRIIWGMTAKMMQSVVDILKENKVEVRPHEE